MTQYAYNCIECGHKNELDPAVVEFCKEVQLSCDECGAGNRLKLAGKP